MCRTVRCWWAAQLVDAMAKAHCLLALAALAQAEIIVPVGAEQGGHASISIHSISTPAWLRVSICTSAPVAAKRQTTPANLTTYLRPVLPCTVLLLHKHNVVPGMYAHVLMCSETALLYIISSRQFGVRGRGRVHCAVGSRLPGRAGSLGPASRPM